MDALATNKKIIIKRRFMAFVMLAVAIIMCVAPAAAYANNTVVRRHDFTGVNTVIRSTSTRDTVPSTARPSGFATITTRNAQSNGIRCRMIVDFNSGGNRVTVTGAWATRLAPVVTGRLATGASFTSPRISSQVRTGTFTAEGQRRALATSQWTASGTIRAVTSW